MPEHTSITTQPQLIPAAAKEAKPVQEINKENTNIESLRIPLQCKLSIGAVDDPLELEADAMADKVMRMSEPFVQRKCVHCEEEEKAQRKPITSFIQRKAVESNSIVNDAVFSQIQSSKGSGSSMDSSTKSFMESRFGADFSNVNIHTGNDVSQLSNQLNAQAFTVDNNIYFGEGKYQPESFAGKHLLAHELTHVMQQSEKINKTTQLSKAPDKLNIQRKKIFDSTVSICHRVLQSRTFHVANGGVKVNLYISQPELSIKDCKNHPFHLTLTKVKDWWFNAELSDCTSETGKNTSLAIGNLSEGDYYFTIWRSFDHPYCCIEGEMEVFDENIRDSSGCEIIKQKSTVEIIHDILDVAGFIPVLGAVPDGINAVIYAAEGDWTNVGISAIAMIPEFGDAASLAIKGEKTIVKIEAKAALKLDEEAVAKGLKEAKAVKEAEKAAAESEKAAKEAERVAKEAAEKEAKRKIEKCLAIYAAKEALGDCKSCKGTDTAAERATKIACLTAEIAAREAYLKENCDDFLEGSLARKKKGQDPEGGHRKQLAEKVGALARCGTLPINK